MNTYNRKNIQEEVLREKYRQMKLHSNGEISNDSNEKSKSRGSNLREEDKKNEKQRTNIIISESNTQRGEEKKRAETNRSYISSKHRITDIISSGENRRKKETGNINITFNSNQKRSQKDNEANIISKKNQNCVPDKDAQKRKRLKINESSEFSHNNSNQDNNSFKSVTISSKSSSKSDFNRKEKHSSDNDNFYNNRREVKKNHSIFISNNKQHSHHKEGKTSFETKFLEEIKEENYRLAEDIGDRVGNRIALEIAKLGAEIKTFGTEINSSMIKLGTEINSSMKEFGTKLDNFTESQKKANQELVIAMKNLRDDMILLQREEHNTFLRLAMGPLGNVGEKKEDK